MSPNPYALHCGDALDVLAMLPRGETVAVLSDPPYGMEWDTDSTRFSGGRRLPHEGRSDFGAVAGDAEPFDPSPWLNFPHVVLWGSNHYAQRLPVGTTLVWVKKAEHLYGTFLSDAEVGWMKGGHGVYCNSLPFPPTTKRIESGTRRSAHPTQKPVALMEWAMERAKVPADAIVLDPYMGSGTTGVAAARTGRRFIGVERDPRYFAVAQERIAGAYAQGSLFSGDGHPSALSTLAPAEREGTP